MGSWLLGCRCCLWRIEIGTALVHGCCGFQASYLSPPYGDYFMVNYEEVPDGSWMILEFNNDDILAHSLDIGTILSIMKEKYDEREDVYISVKHKSIIP